MPALKMKSKSVSNSVRGYNLHSCHKATKTSKGSRSQVKTSQQAAAAVLDASEQNPHNGSSNIELSGQDDEITEADDFQDILAGFSNELLKFPPVLSDHIPAERMGSLSAPCSSNLETIFSPNFEHSDTQYELLDHNSEVRDEQCALPNLVAEESDDGSCTPSDFQSCDLVDLYLSENNSSLPFDGCMEFPDIISAVCPDYERINSDIMMDMAERYMILPFLEKTAETSDVCDEDSDEGAMNSDDSCLYLAIHQVKSSDQETETDQHIDDIEETESFDPQFVCRNLPDLSEAVSSFCPIWWPKEARSRKPITLVLDLDETLVHSTLDHCDDADFTFPVFFNMKQHTVYVRRRPYLQIFLERVAQMFEIVIFTASQSIYAEQLLDILDPDRKLISQRIYRESCIFSDGNYTKDLTILGVDLAKVAIIDNSPQVFRLQVNNGIPIKSWFDDPSDHALISLLPFLETLVDADDVRPIIAKRYGNTE